MGGHLLWKEQIRHYEGKAACQSLLFAQHKCDQMVIE